LNDPLEARMLRNPVENLIRLADASNKCGAIASTTWLDFWENSVSVPFATNVNNLFDGVAAAIPK
jgi:hypothetical protein